MCVRACVCVCVYVCVCVCRHVQQYNSSIFPLTLHKLCTKTTQNEINLLHSMTTKLTTLVMIIEELKC